MNDLYTGYPDHVEIDSKKYIINTDFRLMMQFEIAAQHENKNEIGKVILNFYHGNLPDNIDAAVREMIGFYLCGEVPDDKKTSSGNHDKKRCYAFDEDWKYIISAFRHQYGIDIINSKMHWYEFSALFSGLTGETEFVKIMQYRCTDIRKIKNKEEKNRIKRLQQRYALSENKIKHFPSAADRDADMINNLRKSLLQRK